MIGCLSFNPLGWQSDISIHTSVKEAAGNVPGKGSPPYIFQSMPPRRRRPLQEIQAYAGHQFQSTPPRRRRRNTFLFILLMFFISIHASAKEAIYDFYRYFQSFSFQSTPPRRRRPQHIVIPQLSCTYLVSTTFLSTIFSFISQYVVLFFLF